MLEGRTSLGLATKRQTQRPFPQSPGSGTSYMAAQGCTIVGSRDLRRRGKIPYSFTLQIPDILENPPQSVFQSKPLWSALIQRVGS